MRNPVVFLSALVFFLVAGRSQASDLLNLGYQEEKALPRSLVSRLPDIKERPAPVAFQNWRIVEETDETLEYFISFPSAFLSRYETNNTVQLRILVPAERRGPIPVVLILHYWGAQDLRVERSLASELNRRGVAAAILALPYHLGRTPKGFSSGELAIQSDVSLLKETMTQSLLDVRRSIDFVQSRSEFQKAPLGIAGVSLGAIVSSLGYALDARISHAAFLVGGIDLAGILWTSSRVLPQRDLLRRQGYTEDRLRTELASVEPANYLPRKEPGRSFVIKGAFDSVVPDRNSDLLVEKLSKPAVLLLDTGHYGGIFVQRRLLSEISSFFATEFSGRLYTPPDRIIAPTIRVGLTATSFDGLSVVAGLDVWRDKKHPTTFASLLLTPRYPMVFVGAEFSNGLSGGIFASPRSLGVGFFWSTVL